MNIKKYSVALLLAGTAITMTGLPMGMISGTSSLAAADSAKKADINPSSIVDEVLWVVGDEPILKSEVEVMKLQGEAEGVQWKGNPETTILEQIAVQKLFLHQAALDSIEVTETEVSQGVEQQINYWISLPQIGSKEKLEQYQRKSLAQIRQDLRDDFRNRQLVQRMQESLVSDVKVSPAEVREYFKKLPVDSIPMIPTTVEVQIITQTPRVEQEEVNRIKTQLREYTDRVTKGETSFEALARFYSEDPGSARLGGELGYMGRGMLDPAFAAAAFNLTDPKRLSKVVESEFGYHIIQLIDRRGDKINCRHILLKPKVSEESVVAAKERLDSIGNDIKAGKFTFDEAAGYLSDDKDTKNNHGLMANSSANSRTSKFNMKDLPTEIARAVEGMQVGDVSEPFQMVNAKGKTVCAIVKLKSRVDEHRATITEDFQEMKNIVTAQRRQEIIHDWVVKKVKETYVRMNPRYRNGDFEYEGWVR
ncbi:peptidylprolyl isomerase [Prevotella sp. HUN102]|uniref:peptidylprolyl isomerase n=1 Tax=Prevotella sp. HUN102 TaxID=1392486 RepID=UPI00048C60C4|nr:peptidylprolyl isomerase [Prevotella sp. HUN102]